MKSNNINNIPAEDLIRVCVPAGIGDISWVYSKLHFLRELTGREVVMHIASKGELNRGGELVELFPEVHFGGYLDSRASHECVVQSLPAEWSLQNGGLGLFHYPGNILNMAANIHLELGRPLRDLWPLLPVNYHYPLNFTNEQTSRADQLLSPLPPVRIAVYVSNRAKEEQRAGGWSLWSTDQWVQFLVDIRNTPELKESGFVFLGAPYDIDKTSEVSGRLEAAGIPVARVIGERLGVALFALKRCRLAFCYPSGIGILANVLRVPGLMLLPWLLKGLENSYADPLDLACHTYRAWADPSPEEALHFIRTHTIPNCSGVQ